MNRSDLQRLSQLRLDEAKALASAGFPGGAYYLAGYAIECALKACIARGVQQHEFPDKSRVNQSYTHDFAQLLRAAQLHVEFASDTRADANHAQHWVTAKDWSEERRDDLTISHSKAQRMLNAAPDPTSGVLQWITQRW